MRVSASTGGFRVHAVAGTYVVFFGFDLDIDDCDGLLGFSLRRMDHTEGDCTYLHAQKRFDETDPGFPPGSLYSTREHPIQSFQWSDYSAKPGHVYTYTITALKGTPAALASHSVVDIAIVTEDPAGGDHDIYFNRGLAASQAYVRRFGDQRPNDVVPPNAAFSWLSRGLVEAMYEYIESCIPGVHALRIAAYEFNYQPFLEVVKAAVDAGVDVKVVFDARKDSPKIQNLAAVAAAGLASVSFERTQPKSYISHNKFMVKLQDDIPVSVWTGGTNFSEGGIYGHSNVAHVVQDTRVASDFLAYWTALAADPPSAPLKAEVEALTPEPSMPPPVGTSVIFSPRRDLSTLNWYADLAMSANEGFFMTFAFGMNNIFQAVYRDSTAPFRMALMDKLTRPMKRGPARTAEERKIQDLRNMSENVFAVGNFIRTGGVDGWAKEQLSGLNSHVRFIHNKFMLIDPLSDDPIIVGGSANFSDAATRRNDENMLVVRGNKRVADIYLGEFMRLYTHHAFRESLTFSNAGAPPKALRTDDWWSTYFGETPRSTRRRFFART